MKARTPACQLLQRFHPSSGANAPAVAVAPPVDDWLADQVEGVASADHSILQAYRQRGISAFSPMDDGDMTLPSGWVLFWPKTHQLGIWWLTWLCEQLPPGTPLEIVGEHNGGIKRVPKVLEALGLRCDKLDNARRCSLFATQTQALPTASTAAWQAFNLRGMQLHSHPGVFGHGKLDEGTALLLDTLERALQENKLPGTLRRCLDIGCGDGIISTWLAQRSQDVTAVDINAFAVEACRRTLAANQLTARVLASDVYSALGDEQFDLIVSNPPFHQERDIHYGAAGQLIREAPAHLARGGQLILVANAFLPYADHLEATFGSFEVLADNRRFKVYRAGVR
ncbi:methyltransferase [Vreelandella aquamarina]|uniref:methyltransferase n=1 Tax=Vreelandella aquamarina TaxID=77097 RepID=UPI0038500D0E